MTEVEREDFILKLLDEFKKSIGSAFSTELKLGFTAGARAALWEMREYPISPEYEA